MAVELEGESPQPPQLRVCARKHLLAFTALSLRALTLWNPMRLSHLVTVKLH